MQDMRHSTNKPTPKLRNAPQPPLAYPGAARDADRAKSPALSGPSSTGKELIAGDRVTGLGDFGKPTGEFGTVERSNEEDAVVRWDGDGRKRVHQPSLMKVFPRHKTTSMQNKAESKARIIEHAKHW
jgi:hypothetical protein